jgi:hypothetical protein
MAVKAKPASSPATAPYPPAVTPMLKGMTSQFGNSIFF